MNLPSEDTSCWLIPVAEWLHPFIPLWLFHARGNTIGAKPAMYEYAGRWNLIFAFIVPSLSLRYNRDRHLDNGRLAGAIVSSPQFLFNVEPTIIDE